MKAPEYDKESIYSPLPVTTTEICSWCPTELSPKTDDWMIFVTLPKKNHYILHIECFEVMAWTMTNYVFAHKGDLEPERMVN